MSVSSKDLLELDLYKSATLSRTKWPLYHRFFSRFLRNRFDIALNVPSWQSCAPVTKWSRPNYKLDPLRADQPPRPTVSANFLSPFRGRKFVQRSCKVCFRGFESDEPLLGCAVSS